MSGVRRLLYELGEVHAAGFHLPEHGGDGAGALVVALGVVRAGPDDICDKARRLSGNG